MRSLMSMLVVIVMSLLQAGCLAVGSPKVSIKSIEVTAVNDEAMSVVLHGTVENPHAEELRLLEYDYALVLNGRTAYHGRHAAEMTLISGANREISLPASFPYSKVGWVASALPDTSRWSMSGSLRYLSAGVLAETLLDIGYHPSTGYSASGELVLQASP